jgi:hypothetical protein
MSTFPYLLKNMNLRNCVVEVLYFIRTGKAEGLQLQQIYILRLDTT